MLSVSVQLVVTGLLASSALAQSFNIDVGAATPTPSNAYGAAAAQPGVWNAYAGGTLSNLLDTGGSVTAAAITATGGFASGFNDPLTLGDDEALFDDFLAIPFFETYTVSGLAPGNYDVFVYTWTFGPLSSGFDVNAQGMQVVGGVWANAFTQGVTHSFNSVSLSSGQNITIDVHSINGALGAITGIQIVPIPTPAAPALLLPAAATALLRRRR
ncbi:MAG: hypothetical protein KF745_05390 [Phycisphaeraceae bacterium]|nr:hypothetical protein [Phycisphaeraceae bacterium]